MQPPAGLVFQAGGEENPMAGLSGAILGLEGPVAHPPRLSTTPPAGAGKSDPRTLLEGSFVSIVWFMSPTTALPWGPRAQPRGQGPPPRAPATAKQAPRGPPAARPTGRERRPQGPPCPSLSGAPGAPRPHGGSGGWWHGLCSGTSAFVPSWAGTLCGSHLSCPCLGVTQTLYERETLGSLFS